MVFGLELWSPASLSPTQQHESMNECNSAKDLYIDCTQTNNIITLFVHKKWMLSIHTLN